MLSRKGCDNMRPCLVWKKENQSGLVPSDIFRVTCPCTPGVEVASGPLQPRERHSENFGRILSFGGIVMRSHPLFVNDRSSLLSSPFFSPD